jgi:signal transduction histidine kinase
VAAGRIAGELLASPWRAALLAVVAIALPLLLIDLLSVSGAREGLRAKTLADQHRAADEAARFVSAEVTQLRDGLSAAAVDPGIQGAVVARDQAALDRALTTLRALLPREALLVVALDERGTLLGIQPPAPELIGRDFSGRDYFTGVSRAWAPYVSEAYATAVAGAPPAVAVAVPVRDAQGLPRGALVVAIDLGKASDWFARLRAAFTDVHLLDDRGRLITRASGIGGDALADLSADPTVQTLLSGRTVTAETGFLGARRLVASAMVPGVAWHLVVSDDPAALDAAVLPLVGGLASVSLAFLVLALVAASLLARAFRRLARSRAALATANAELAAASQAKSEFVANMSHELRTPLNAILGFSELLAEQLGSQLGERQRRFLRNIHDAGEHLLALINDILDLSKVEAGRAELRPERISLAALVEPVVAAIQQAADARGVRLEVDAAGSAPLWLDPSRVRQILLNLLSNATKFTPAGGTVRLEARLHGRDLALIVADTGIGIPLELQNRVFGVFERPNEGRSDAAGTGLGLALTKRLVELHGGAIEFRSASDAGTTFAVTLPEVSAAPVAGERLLVVEDERRDADLIVALAARAGLPTEVVATVAGALAAIEGPHPPLAAVVDLRLPDGRGETVVAAARAATPPIPVVVVSVEDDDRVLRSRGVDDQIAKPIDHDRLAGWLAGVAARRATSSGREVA